MQRVSLREWGYSFILRLKMFFKAATVESGDGFSISVRLKCCLIPQTACLLIEHDERLASSSKTRNFSGNCPAHFLTGKVIFRVNLRVSPAAGKQLILLHT